MSKALGGVDSIGGLGVIGVIGGIGRIGGIGKVRLRLVNGIGIWRGPLALRLGAWVLSVFS